MMQILRNIGQKNQTKKIGILLVAVLFCFISMLHLPTGETYSEYIKIDPLIDTTLHQKEQFMVEFSGGTVLEGVDIHQIENMHDHFRSWMTSRSIDYIEKTAMTHTSNSMILSMRSSDIPSLSQIPYIYSIFPLKGAFVPARGIALRHIDPQEDNQPSPYTGKGIRVGIIDTGIQLKHPELKDRVKGGMNFANSEKTHDDQGFHGTFVAGVIGGAGWDGYHRGIAPDVEFMSYVVFEYGRAMSVSIFPALEQAVRDRCDIVVLSLNGMIGFDPGRERDALMNALAHARKAGIAVIAAAGNEGQPWRNVDRIRLPGSSPDVLTVGSTNDRKDQWIDLESSDGQKRRIKGQLGMPSTTFKAEWSKLPLRLAGFGRKDEFDGAKEKAPFIALVHRGPVHEPITFHEKMRNARDAGAKGVIFVNYPGADILQPRVDSEIFDKDWHKNTIPSCMVDYASFEGVLEDPVDWNLHFSTRYPSVPDVWTSSGPVQGSVLKPDLVAPGILVYSIVGLGYQWASGSSISAGFVAGAAACIMEAYPDWSVDKVFSSLVNSSLILRNAMTERPFSWHMQGAGEMNLTKALEATLHLSPFSLRDIYRGDHLRRTVQISNNQNKAVHVDIKVHMITTIPGARIPFEIDYPQGGIELGAKESRAIEIVFKVSTELVRSQHYEGWFVFGDLHLPFVIEFPDFQKSYAPVQYLDVSPRKWDMEELFNRDPLKVSFLLTSGSRVLTEHFEYIKNHAVVSMTLIDNFGLEWGQLFYHNECYPDYYDLSFERLFLDRKAPPPDGSYFLAISVWGIERGFSAIQHRETIPIEIVNSKTQPVHINWTAYRKQNTRERFIISLVADQDLHIQRFIMECRFRPGQLTCQSIQTRSLDRITDCRLQVNRIGSNAQGIIYTDWYCPDNSFIFIPKGTPLLEMGFEGLYAGEASISISKLYALGSNGEHITFRSSGLTCFVYDQKFLRGDLNDDGKVDDQDWLLMSKAFGASFREEAFDIRCDVNGDGIVDALDLRYLARDYLP